MTRRDEMAVAVVDAPAAGGAVVIPPTNPLTTPPQSGGNGSTGSREVLLLPLYFIGEMLK